MSHMLDWARHEIELALKREKDCDDDDSGFDYAKGCYQSALKAFSSLCEDGHSGMSISLTTDILNRLIKRQPLTPIDDNQDDWSEAWKSNDEVKHYQHKRLSSLFKDAYPDGSVEYNDVEAYECIDEKNNIPYHGGGAGRIFHEYFPVKFPYYPPIKKYRIVTVEYLTDRKNGDFDTKEYVKILTPDGETIPVNRYFGETADGWKELDIEEFTSRVAMHFKREEKEKKEKIQNGSI